MKLPENVTCSQCILQVHIQFIQNEDASVDECHLDFSDGQYLIAMRYRCFFITVMRCRWFLDILTIAIGAIIFAQPLGPIVFRWFSNFRTDVWGWFFVGYPKTTYFTTCSNLHWIVRISVLWGQKGEKFTIIEHLFLLDCFLCALGSNKGAAKLLPSSKTDGFQCHNHNRCDYFCSTFGINYFPIFRFQIKNNC